jgi:hypothetical protein
MFQFSYVVVVQGECIRWRRKERERKLKDKEKEEDEEGRGSKIYGGV